MADRARRGPRDGGAGVITGEQRGLLRAFAFLVMAAGIAWGALYLAYGETLAAIPPLGFGTAVLLSLVAYRWHRSDTVLRDTLIALIIPLPFVLQLILGGFAASGAVVMWSVMAVFGSLVLAGTRAAAFWLGVFAIEITAAAVLDPAIAHPNKLPQPIVLGFFAANIVAMAAIAFATIAMFLVQRDRAMAALAREQERSEALLLNVLPKEIVPRLKAGEDPIADAYDEATVLFADIVGSTKLAERLDAKELVALLNEVFSRFDLLAERHGVEKIRTIGDNYMCVAGVPRARPDHAQAVARLALDMCASLDELRARGEHRIAVRIGMNSGPCVGGVIGRRKFEFDIWGDPVNTASRMESHGVPGRIHLSDATYDLLGDGFDYEARGFIDVKGKGLMRTWFLLGERTASAATPADVAVGGRRS